MFFSGYETDTVAWKTVNEPKAKHVIFCSAA